MHHSHPILVTIVAAIAFGVLLIAVARRLGVPSIVLLLAGGVVLGPEVLGVVHPDELGQGLRVIISLLVGIILFEGGLTLELGGYRRAPRVILRLLTVGVITTWSGIAVVVWLVAGHSLTLSITSASLLIVTGPTVVGPLLARIRVSEKIHHVLQWEGVLIDPIGVFIALLCVELFAMGLGTMALVGLGLRVVTGVVLGLVGGVALERALARRLIPSDLAGAGSLATAVLLFGASELLAPESGLLSVTLAGFYVGSKRPEGIAAIRHFKQEMTEVAIGMLFILLSARLDLAQFLDFGLEGVVLVLLIMFLVRPLTVLASTFGLDVTWRERALLSWIAPRGIVAASMASLLAIELERRGTPHPRFVETLTYAVIVGTIVVQGFTAGRVARLLGLERPPADTWLVVGAHALAREVARCLVAHGERVVIVDQSRQAVREATRAGLPALVADAWEVEATAALLTEGGIGRLLALTDREADNRVLCRLWSTRLGAEACYRWQSGEASGEDGQVVWSDLPDLAAVAAEVEAGVARIVKGARPSAHGTHALFREVGGKLQVAASSAGDAHLFLERDVGRETWSPVRLHAIEVAVETPQEVVEQVVARLAEDHPELDVAALTAAIWEQEELLPSGLDEGIALPHALVPSLGAPIVAAVKLGRPILWGPDGPLVDIVFLLLSPAEDPDAHLGLLRDVARHVVEPRRRRRLRATPTERWPRILRSSWTRAA